MLWQLWRLREGWNSATVLIHLWRAHGGSQASMHFVDSQASSNKSGNYLLTAHIILILLFLVLVYILR